MDLLPSSKELGQLLSINQTAMRLGLKPISIRGWVKKGILAHVRLGDRILVPESIDRLIAQATDLRSATRQRLRRGTSRE